MPRQRDAGRRPVERLWVTRGAVHAGNNECADAEPDLCFEFHEGAVRFALRRRAPYVATTFQASVTFGFWNNSNALRNT
jgi:hypothetical protein